VFPGLADGDLHVEIVRVGLGNLLEAEIDAFQGADIVRPVNFRIHFLELIERMYHEQSQFLKTSKSIPFMAGSR
jgi:hypothetical protein